MNATRIVISPEESAASIRWEPCAEAHVEDSGAVCVDCGWPTDDHAGTDPRSGSARAA